ncbi:MAG: YhcH/YjgK/YiaL family protein [Verrucomicrobia bacterium]|nr:YhcH/YjgK/YiaL family protein [Verrucomicrobiota bacterium]
MVGKIEDFVGQASANQRLQRGLAILQDYREGRRPDITRLVSSQRAGDSEKIMVEGDALFLIVQCYHPRPREQGKFEAHQRYTDVQYVCAGQEWIEVCDLRAQPGELPAYDANGNIFFALDRKAQGRVLLRAGEGAVLFPNDAHAPCLRVDGDAGGLVRKIVVKIKDAHVPDVERRVAAGSVGCQ